MSDNQIIKEYRIPTEPDGSVQENYEIYLRWIKDNPPLVISEPPRGGTVDLGWIDDIIK